MSHTRSRRSRLEIYIETLEAVQTIHNPSQIMSTVGMSSTLTRTVLDGLIDGGFIRVKPVFGDMRSTTTYHLTKKGETFLRKYNNETKEMLELIVDATMEKV
ncbi:hypothetical protein D4R42_04520 [bacterium]|nr:MAG: hypothetical protein D4R42_04520 [bacterium]